MRTKWISTLMTLALAVVFMPALAMAQVGTSSISGQVTDPQGNSVAGASVKLVSSTGTSRTIVTNNDGLYTFSSVQTGTYTVEVEMKGFKKAVIADVRALVDSTTNLNVKVEIGEVTEVVNVDAAGLESLVNTTDASTGNNFVSQQILQLPLQARNVTNLLSLQAGVTPDGSVVGGRADQANITLDGVDVNNQQNASAFESVLRVNPDSVDEFRVTTANSDATKGRSSGAQISLITKSGSNEWRGALYEYHRNTATAANEWFNNAAGHWKATDSEVLAGRAVAGEQRLKRPKLIRNLFGGRLGGPIVKNRLFFFYNYEGMREAKEATVARTVPTASLGAGTIRFDDNTGQSWNITAPQINTFVLAGNPVVDVNTAVTALFASAASRYPVNDNTLGDGRNTGGFRFNAPVPVTQNMHTARFDWNVTNDQKHTISLRGNYQQDITGAAPYLPDTPPTNFWSHPLGMVATHTWLIKSNMTNRFSWGLTRLAYSDQSDSSDTAITFRSVFQPVAYRRGVDRTNPTHNFTNDFTWITGNHTIQMGTNVRLIKNSRTSFARAYDRAGTNFSWSPSNIARQAVRDYIRLQTGSTTRDVASSWSSPLQHALIAIFGRLNDYGANYNFNLQGGIIPPNQGIERIFKTEEYDFYFQDSWKVYSNLTLNLGLRYGLSMPVYEAQGYETIPSIPLGDYLERTIAAMQSGINYREPISINLAGKANGRESIYKLDTDNFQPRVSVAWSPDFGDGMLANIFGRKDKAVIRAGFAITNDYFGQQLAVNWDNNNSLGFSSGSNLNANFYNITTNPGPAYTGPSMNVRSFPGLVVPGALTFPLTAPQVTPGNGPIQRSLDQNLQSPINYSWNFTYGRELPWKMWLDVGYQARLARKLLIGRDAMMLRGDIRDNRSGLSYNQAATILDRQLQARVNGFNVAPVPFFENMWVPGTLQAVFGCPVDPGTGLPMPTCTNTQAVYNGQPLAGDWTYMMQQLDAGGNTRYFFQGQYDSLAVYSTAGSSDYHGGFLSLRQRLAGVTWDLNYTYSKSLDEASGLQTADSFGAAFVLNAFNLKDQRSYSDFDLRHVVNFNGLYDIPIGRGRKFGKGMNKFADALIGGWSMSGVFRWDTGYPFDGYYDATGWQTNWNVRSYMTQVRPLTTGTNFGVAAASCATAQQNNPTIPQGCDLPNLFANPDQAYAAFRTPHPGETGTRNPLRYPGTWNIDLGIAKSFNMPWKEGHKITIRADAFNLTNTPFFGGQSLTTNGYTGSAAGVQFGRFTGTSNAPRVMQFAFRYDF